MLSRRVLVGACVLSIFWAVAVAASDTHATKGSINWSFHTVEDDADAFSHVSVAVDPVSGAAFISYYDIVNQELRWARTVDSGGNCGPDSSWLCEPLVSGADVGLYNSIAVHPAGGGASDVLISFYDATNEYLTCVRGIVDGTSASMSLTLIDSGFHDPDRTGMYTAAAFDLTGVPWIAYQNETYDDMVGTHYMIARWVGDGSGNCGEVGDIGDWQCTTLFSTGWDQAFSWSGISFDDENNPVVAYFNEHEAKPEVAHWVASGGDCGPSDSWQCHLVAPRDGDTLIGWHVVPYLANNVLTLFYQNPQRDVLERAVYVGGSGGNCGYNTTGLMVDEWQCDSIWDMDGSGQARAIAVAPDTGNYPIVAFQYGNDPAPAGLAIARPTESPEVNATGNCGPGDSWYCEILSGGPYLTEAGSVAIDTEPRGKITIAYNEVDSYPHPAEHNLKIAILDAVEVFSDDFESSTASEWSLIVP